MCDIIKLHVSICLKCCPTHIQRNTQITFQNPDFAVINLFELLAFGGSANAKILLSHPYGLALLHPKETPSKT